MDNKEYSLHELGEKLNLPTNLLRRVLFGFSLIQKPFDVTPTQNAIDNGFIKAIITKSKATLLWKEKTVELIQQNTEKTSTIIADYLFHAFKFFLLPTQTNNSIETVTHGITSSLMKREVRYTIEFLQNNNRLQPLIEVYDKIESNSDIKNRIIHENITEFKKIKSLVLKYNLETTLKEQKIIAKKKV